MLLIRQASDVTRDRLGNRVLRQPDTSCSVGTVAVEVAPILRLALLEECLRLGAGEELLHLSLNLRLPRTKISTAFVELLEQEVPLVEVHLICTL